MIITQFHKSNTDTPITSNDTNQIPNGKYILDKYNNHKNADSSFTSLWIGNLDSNFTEDILNEMFSVI